MSISRFETAAPVVGAESLRESVGPYRDAVSYTHLLLDPSFAHLDVFLAAFRGDFSFVVFNLHVDDAGDDIDGLLSGKVSFDQL